LLKRSLTQSTNSNLTLTTDTQSESVTVKIGSSDNARLSSATALGLAALSVGATAGMLLPFHSEEALAAESAIHQPLIHHRVQDGDTLWEISQSYGVPTEAIAVSNAIQGDVLTVGQTLQIPASSSVEADVESAIEPSSAIEEPTIVAAVPVEASPIPDAAATAIDKTSNKADSPEIVAEESIEQSQDDVAESIDVEETVSQPEVVAVVPDNEQIHHIAPGETFEGLAAQYDIPVQALVERNRDADANNLQIGQSIVIPESQLVAQSRSTAFITPRPNRPDVVPDSHIRILKDDVMRMREEIRNQNAQQAVVPTTPAQQPEVATTPVHPEWQRQQLNKPERGDSDELIAAAPVPTQGYNRLLQLPAGQAVEPQIPPLLEREEYLPDSPQTFNGYIWPARGTFTSGYGPRWGRMHRGIDIAAPTGTPIHAAAAGEVISAGWNNGGYGNLVEIRHPDGSMTRYAHNSRILVRRGDRVEQGQQISLMGSTGYSTGPHLHFEVHPAGRGAVNPMAFLPSKRN
jgi:murein DD-endopeptidase MepM/ murein hydrolase activator NlpD